MTERKVIEIFCDSNTRKATKDECEKKTARMFKGIELSELTKEEESEIELKELELRLHSQTEELELTLKHEIEMHVAMQQALLEVCDEIFLGKNFEEFNEEEKQTYFDLKDIYDAFVEPT